MSVVSKNPFDLLGDDGGDSSPAPVKATPKPAEPAAPPKAIPGAPKPDAGANGRRGRGGYPGRGAPRNVYRDDGPRNTGPTADEGVAEGMETPGGFDGERIPNPRKGNHVRDAHTKGPRGSRPARNLTSGGHTSSGAGHIRGGRTPAQGGERRQFERRSGGLPDSQKKIEHGWGADEGGAELTAEVEGQNDAVAEEKEAAKEGDGGWGAPDAVPEVTAATDAAAEAAPEEPEEVQKSLDEFMAERAAAQLALGKKEGRQVNTESLEGKAFVREAIDEFFSGKEKAAAPKVKAAKKEKVFIEVDGQFASPAGGRPTRGTGERGGRGGRGGGAGRGDARGARGGGRGRGAPRGGRGGFGGAQGSAAIDASDKSAFPALGA